MSGLQRGVEVLVQRVQRKRVFAYDAAGSATYAEPSEQDAIKEAITRHFAALKQPGDDAATSKTLEERGDYLGNVEKSLFELNQILSLAVQLKTKEYASLTTCTRPATTLHAPLRPLNQRVQHVRDSCASASDILRAALANSVSNIAKRRSFVTQCLDLRKHWKITSTARKTTLSLDDGLAVDCSSACMPIADVVPLSIEDGAVVRHRSSGLHTLVVSLQDASKGCLGSVRMYDLHFASAQDTVESYCQSMQHDALARRCFYMLQQHAQKLAAVVSSPSTNYTSDMSSMSLSYEETVIRLDRGHICVAVSPTLSIAFSLQLQKAAAVETSKMDIEDAVDYNKTLSLVLLYMEMQVIERCRDPLNHIRAPLVRSITRFLRYRLIHNFLLRCVDDIKLCIQNYGLVCSAVRNASRGPLADELLIHLSIDGTSYHIALRDVITITSSRCPTMFRASSIKELLDFLCKQAGNILLSRFVPDSARYIADCDLYALYSTSPPYGRLGSVSATLDGTSLVVKLKTQCERLTTNLLQGGKGVTFVDTGYNTLSCSVYTIEECASVKELIMSEISRN